jgi:4-amino-4-deoxy-L-arabinose transferase-like glycosyltransferase
LAYSAAGNSATFDEPAHLAAGVEYWKHHDLSIYSLSPPLLRLWAGIPAVLAGAQAPPTDQVDRWPIVERHWLYADAFVAANFSRFAFLLLMSRLGMIPISCFAGWITYRWTNRLYGWRSAIAACAMYCLNPTILAHGALVTTDVGTAAAMLASCWLWWRFCRSPSAWRWILLCAALLAAHLCKFTAVLLWPMMLAMSLPFVPWRQRGRRWVLPAAWVALGMTTLVGLNAVYGFRGTGRPLGSFTFDSDFLQRLRQELPASLPSPIPRTLLLGIDAQKRDSQPGYEAFLFGEVYQGSRWYYFPAALLCKLPISMLLLLAAAVASKLGSRGRPPPATRAGEWSIFFALAFFLLGVIVVGDLNIGTRYLLPAFPLAFILVSRIWSVERRTAGKTRSFFPYLRDTLLVLLAAETLWVCPRFLTFVNFAVGGPSNGWRLLSNSDFDWGQGLIDLRHWMQEHRVSGITLTYFGFVDPAAYGIHYTPIIERSNADYVAVSSYFLDGLKTPIVTRWDPATSRNERTWIGLRYSKALQAKTPVAVVGHTIFIYSLDEVESAGALSAGP